MRCRACNSKYNVVKVYGDYYCGECRQSISDTIFEDRTIHELHKEDRLRDYSDKKDEESKDERE